MGFASTINKENKHIINRTNQHFIRLNQMVKNPLWKQTQTDIVIIPIQEGAWSKNN